MVLPCQLQLLLRYFLGWSLVQEPRSTVKNLTIFATISSELVREMARSRFQMVDPNCHTRCLRHRHVNATSHHHLSRRNILKQQLGSRSEDITVTARIDSIGKSYLQNGSIAQLQLLDTLDFFCKIEN